MIAETIKRLGRGEMPRTIFEKGHNKAYTVDEVFFQRLSELSGRFNAPLTINAWLSDSSSIRDLSIAEFVQLPNLASRKIKRVSIATEWSTKPRIQIDLRDQEWGNTVEYTVEGEDRDAFYAAKEIDSHLHNAFMWYSPFTLINPFLKGAVFGAVIGVSGSVLWFAFVDKNYLLGMASIASLALAFTYSSIVQHLFPTATFKIGDGKARAEKVTKRRTVAASILLVVILLGVAVNLLSTRINDWLFPAK